MTISGFLAGLCAALFFHSGIAKLSVRTRFARSLGSFGVPPWMRSFAAAIVITCELLIALALVPEWSRRLSAGMGFVMVLSFTAVLVVSRWRTGRVDCMCFGMIQRVTPVTIGRNAALTVALLLMTLDSQTSSATGVLVGMGTWALTALGQQAAVVLRPQSP